MVKILLVEDEDEKYRLIMSSLLSVDGVTQDDITSAPDAVAAKRALASSVYDLMILDINLPARGGESPERSGGLAVLNFVKQNKKAKRPRYIVGLTAYDDSFDSASAEFNWPVFSLVKFKYGETNWVESLQKSVEFLIDGELYPLPNDGKTYRFDLGIFVALEDEELKSVLNLSLEWTPVVVEYDYTRYFRTTFRDNGRDITVVLAAAPKMGMPPAAVIVSKLIMNFRPKVLAITGICAGVRGKTQLGDILIADPCFDWGSGKWIKIKHGPLRGELRFRPASYQWRLDESLRSPCKALGDDTDLLNAIHEGYLGNKPSKPPRVHIDAMASGASVLQAAKLMENVADQHKNVIGVEMESYAVFTASEYASEPRPICLSIKSVCDFGDEKKNDEMHKYAAYTSAMFLYHLAIRIMGTDCIE